MAKIRYPFGEAGIVALTATGTQAIVIDGDVTIIDGQTVEGTANRTLELTVESEIKAGAKIFVKLKTSATQDTVFGDGFTSPNITGVAGKTFTQSFTFDGSEFLPDGKEIQID